MEFFERISGARMHSNFYKPGLNHRTLNKGIIFDILNFINNTLTTVNELHTVLSTNKI
jgi:NADH-quinone oxidoreductase subunit D